MLVKSGLVSSGSGTLGGFVWSHNAGGQYLRALVPVTNPNTPAQNFVRQSMANLMARWSTVLAQAQRDLWNVYAANVPLPNRFGDPRPVSGANQYVRSNIGRAQAAGLTRVDAAPALFNLGEIPANTAPTAGIGNAIGFAFDDAEPWTIEVGSSLLVYASPPQNPGIQFYDGPFRFAGQIDGAVIPPTSPAAVTSPFLSVAGQKVFFTTRLTRVDGRLSSSQQLEAIVA